MVVLNPWISLATHEMFVSEAIVGETTTYRITVCNQCNCFLRLLFVYSELDHQLKIAFAYSLPIEMLLVTSKIQSWKKFLRFSFEFDSEIQ